MGIDRNQLDREVVLISDPEIATLVSQVLSAAPSYFWVIPSSSTGKYHPRDENVKGGLVKHVKRAVKVANHLCSCWEVQNIARDLVIAATIIHDCCKNGYPEDEKYTVIGHGTLWARVLPHEVTRALINNPKLRELGRLASCHMGRFDPPYVGGHGGDDLLVMIVQAADYISSREDITVEV